MKTKMKAIMNCKNTSKGGCVSPVAIGNPANVGELRAMLETYTDECRIECPPWFYIAPDKHSAAFLRTVNSHATLTAALVDALDQCMEALEAAQDFDEIPDDLAAWARFKDLTKAALGTAKKAREGQ